MSTILTKWKLSAKELTEIVNDNPSLHGFILGYVGEYKLRKNILNDERISNVHKYDDHDRRHKNDVAVRYKDFEFTFEVKSLQSNKVKKRGKKYSATFQCDASDRRAVDLPNGDTIETTCLLVGGFDIVAVNLFAFREKWDFAFALNKDLPRSSSPKYTDEQKKYLLATSVNITWPLRPPFVNDPFVLLGKLVAKKGKSKKK